jgi:transcriptional regulator with XRE-family HTH domain
MELNEIIAINVLKARQELGLTQEELADRAGLSNRYIGAIERATVSISITVLAQVAAALNLEPADLLRD